MLFYAVGSLLFMFGFLAALAVIFSAFRSHGAQMRAALGNLSMDSAYAPARPARTPAQPVTARTTARLAPAA